MKTTRIALKTVAGIGLFVAIVLADNLYPTSKELVSSVVIAFMSGTMYIAAKQIEISQTKKEE